MKRREFMQVLIGAILAVFGIIAKADKVESFKKKTIKWDEYTTISTVYDRETGSISFFVNGENWR